MRDLLTLALNSGGGLIIHSCLIYELPYIRELELKMWWAYNTYYYGSACMT